MWIITLGMTIILAKLFPIGGELVGMVLGSMSGPVLGKIPPAVLSLIMLLATYAPAALFAAIFVRKAQLKNRLPRGVPGRKLIIAGVLWLGVFVAVAIFASRIRGGGAGFVVSMFGPYLIIPADILIVVGVVKALLAALPRRSSFSSGPPKRATQGA